ncbi:hypothetical protein [Natranaeroarchaeum aerophilus]|uniref:Uncharacterized protein n=1 Tax=Natranaeroarchaeum aerophilus TaxID=2917711 RepID=A0AAE3FP84_9EURY|nr:hypothetical protein [Natranaeroarchaeum aerophilus]MCL9812586.1 hypothetical protein [Natranaeroarchaeum aerophilus]
MSGDTSGTFGGWSDRLTYIAAEGQLVVLGIAFSIGVLLLWFRPSVPGVPPIAFGWFAALLILGPPLLAMFVTGARKLRNRHMVEVHHINGVTDKRRKLDVAPELWDAKKVEGPSPYPVNDGDAYEVREFEYDEELDQLRVRGCYFSQLADSKLVTVKAMLEDIHGDLIEEFIASNRLRGRISKMGVEIQSDVVNKEAEADERGLMNPRTTVKERFESARDDVEDASIDEIRDMNDYVDEYTDEHGIDAVGGPPQTRQQAATDGGTNE